MGIFHWKCRPTPFHQWKNFDNRILRLYKFIAKILYYTFLRHSVHGSYFPSLLLQNVLLVHRYKVICCGCHVPGETCNKYETNDLSCSVQGRPIKTAPLCKVFFGQSGFEFALSQQYSGEAFTGSPVYRLQSMISGNIHQQLSQAICC